VAVDPAHLRALAITRPQHVIDVGANGGQFALACIGAQSIQSVVSFEPLAEAARKFTMSVRDHRVQLREIGLGSEPGLATLHISNRDDSSSLLRITDVQSATFPGTERSAERTVRISTVDSEFPNIHGQTLLKIDVQGFELEVLRGAQRSLHNIDWVLCEVSFREFYEGQALANEVIALMDGAGFIIHGIIDTTAVAGLAVQADLLFERRERPSSETPPTSNVQR
jgi:FkbM family methyltransferase